MEEEEAWPEHLLEMRQQKNDYFKYEDSSPIPFDDRHTFSGLKYFDPDKSYVVEAKLHKSPKKESLVMATSKGTEQKFHKVGYFEFPIGGKKIKLSAYKSADRQSDELFIPFRDKTSGKQTYGAARYLDLEEEKGDDYLIDFNYAYNPYCAYSENYVCPLPPKENWLQIEIKAGEKKYHD